MLTTNNKKNAMKAKILKNLPLEIKISLFTLILDITTDLQIYRQQLDVGK